MSATIPLILGMLGASVEPIASTPKQAAKFDASQVAALSIDPPSISLDDPRSKQRILVTALVKGRPIDVTDQVALSSTKSDVAQLNQRLEVVPLADGESSIVAKLGSVTAHAPVKVRRMTQGRPINFTNEIIPIFSKLSCNSGGCHGKSGGQNGFALSLLGYQPADDYDFLVKEGRGRRLFPAAPSQSLLVRKATGEVAHGGGKLLKPDDEKHDLLLAWIKQGMPFGSDNDPHVVKIEVFPAERVLDKKSVQRLRVHATFSDGRGEDVTRFAQFQSNDESVASVDESGAVRSQEQAGEAAIMARYLGQVAVFRAQVPTGMDASASFTPRQSIDELVSKKWKSLGLAPSPLVGDSGFIRRLTLDLCGRLPTPAEVTTFLADKRGDKRERLIDELLASRDYASWMALKWGALLQNKRGARDDYTAGTHALSLWLKDAFQRDMPYDRFVREILTATGDTESNPPAAWFRVVRTNEENVDNVSQLFLGTRIQCARCHHHPFEKWSQDDYFGMASFFARVGRKQYDLSANGNAREAVFVARGGTAHHPRTGAAIPPRGLDGKPLSIPAGSDPRAALVDWMTRPDNPYFARALVNRLWGHFFQRGIVEPIDDLRVTNPPTNPELLDALARQFVSQGYSIKKVIKTICSSTTYQLSSEPTPSNGADRQNFARHYPKRLSAEVLLDAMDQVTGIRTSFGYPPEWRAVDLPDEQVGSYFLDVFGRPQRASSCECERTSEANLSQALHLLNSSEVHGKLVSDAGRAAQLAADPRPDREKVSDLFLWFFARYPLADELKHALDHIASKTDKRQAYQNLIWALLNSKEFQFNT